MRILVIACVLVLAPAGCKDDPEPPRRGFRGPPPAPPAQSAHVDCVAAAKGELGSPGGTGLGPAVDAELRVKREALIVRLCDEDHWPLEAALCYADADRMMDLARCWLPLPMSTRLTDELQGLMRRELHLPPLPTRR